MSWCPDNVPSYAKRIKSPYPDEFECFSFHDRCAHTWRVGGPFDYSGKCEPLDFPHLDNIYSGICAVCVPVREHEHGFPMEEAVALYYEVMPEIEAPPGVYVALVVIALICCRRRG